MVGVLLHNCYEMKIEDIFITDFKKFILCVCACTGGETGGWADFSGVLFSAPVDSDIKLQLSDL